MILLDHTMPKAELFGDPLRAFTKPVCFFLGYFKYFGVPCEFGHKCPQAFAPGLPA